MPGDLSRLERDACTFAAQFRAFTATAPSLCHHCFYVFAGGLNTSAHGYLSTKCPDFLDAVLGFVVSDFFASDWERRKAMSTEMLVFQTLSCPTCSPLGIRDLMHADFMMRSNEIPFDTLFDLCCRLLTRCLVPTVQRHTPTSPSKIPKKPFRSGSWPSRFEQLFPRGAEQTVGHLVQLACVIQSGPIALLAAMLQRCRQPVFEEIMHPRYNCLLLRRVIAALGEAAELASAALSAHNQSIGSPNASRMPTSDRAVLKAIAKYDDFAVLLRAISSGVDYEVHDLDRFAFCYEARLYHAVVSVLEKLYDPFAWDSNIPNVAIFLYSSLDAADRHNPPIFIRRAVLEGSKRMGDPYTRVACNLPIVLQRRACFGLRCGKQVHENPSGKAFAKCARCRAIQYCSKECQRNDWTLKNGQPHKIICDILSEVLTIVPREAVVKTAPDDIARAWRDADLSLERVQRLNLWILGHDSGALSTAYTELLHHSIGTTVEPQSFKDCKTKDEMMRFIERVSECRFPPGSRIVLVPVRDPRGDTEGDEFEPSVTVLSAEEESGSYEEIQLENDEHYCGPYLFRVIPPGNAIE